MGGGVTDNGRGTDYGMEGIWARVTSQVDRWVRCDGCGSQMSGRRGNGVTTSHTLNVGRLTSGSGEARQCLHADFEMICPSFSQPNQCPHYLSS